MIAAQKKQKKSDGRPPDTSHKLVKHLSDAVHYCPDYRWKNNSCWLDCSLELMFLAIVHNFHTDFEPCFYGMCHASPLWHLYKLFIFACLCLRMLMSVRTCLWFKEMSFMRLTTKFLVLGLAWQCPRLAREQTQRCKYICTLMLRMTDNQVMILQWSASYQCRRHCTTLATWVSQLVSLIRLNDYMSHLALFGLIGTFPQHQQ
jgi:hypothetical protein